MAFVRLEDVQAGFSAAAAAQNERGVKPGGTTGQVLSKTSDDDFDTEWVDQSGGGGGTGLPAGGTTGQALKKTSGSDFAAAWATTHEVPAGGSTGQVLKKSSGADHDYAWAADATGGGGVTIDTDGAMTANSDLVVPSQKAVRTYVAAFQAASDAMVFKGVIDCSANPNYPAADAGATYRVSVAGKIGGGSGPNVQAGDILICLADSTAAGNHATVGSSWSIIQTNIDGALVTTDIGTTIQAYSAQLAAIAGLTTTTFGRSILTQVDAAAVRTLYGLVIGTDVQAYDADLAAIALLSTTSFGRALLTAADGSAIKPLESMVFAISDEATAITTGTAKITVRMPYAFTLLAGNAGIRASLNTASSSGLPTVDMNVNGSTILSTKLTIDASEKTSLTAATAVVISNTALLDDDEVTFDIDVAGTGAKGLKVMLRGYRT